MWTAILLSTDRRPDGMTQATVKFQSDDPQFQAFNQAMFGDTFDDKALNAFAYNKLQSLNAGDTAFVALKTVPPGPLTPTKPLDNPPV